MPTPEEERDEEAELHEVRERLRMIGDAAREQRKQAQYSLPDLASHRVEALIAVLERVQTDLDELYD